MKRQKLIKTPIKYLQNEQRIKSNDKLKRVQTSERANVGLFGVKQSLCVLIALLLQVTVSHAWFGCTLN